MPPWLCYAKAIIANEEVKSVENYGLYFKPMLSFYDVCNKIYNSFFLLDD